MSEEGLPWRFIEVGAVTVSEPYDEESTPAEAQYLAVSNRYGFTVLYAAPSNLLFMRTKLLYELAAAKANLVQSLPAEVVKVPVQGYVRGLHLSQDEMVLGVVKRRSVLFFSVKSLEQKNTIPLGKVRICASKEEEVRQIAWHPVVPNILLALTSKGKISVINSSTRQAMNWCPALEAENVTSIAWSLSGKIVLCGCKGGNVLLASNDGSVRRKFTRPEDAFSGDEIEAHQVANFTGRTVGAAYRVIADGEPTGDAMLYTTEIPAQASEEPKFTQFDRLGMPMPNRPNLYYFGWIKDWNLLLVGGSNFPEIEIIGQQNGQFDQLNLEDAWRAQVPLREDDSGDNHLIGMAIDFTKTDSTPDPKNPDRTPFAPSPVLCVLVDGGQLIPYVFVKTDLPKDENLKLPFMRQAVPIPATQNIPSLADTADSVPSVILSAGAATASTAGPTPPSPSTGRSSLRQASTGLAATKPSAASATLQQAPTSSSSGQPFNFTGGNTPFSLPAPVTDLKPTEIKPPGLAKTPATSAAPFTFSPVAGDSASKPSILPTTAPPAKPAPGKAGSESSAFTFPSSSPAFAFPTPSGTAATSSGMTPKMKAKEDAKAAPSFSVPAKGEPVSFAMPTPKAATPSGPSTAAKPTTETRAPTIAPVGPAASAAQKSAPPVTPAGSAPRKPLSGDGGDTRDLQNQFVEQIASFEKVLEEVRQAERETAKLMERVKNGPRSTDGKEFTLAGLNYLRDMTDRLIDDVNNISEQNVQQQQSQKQVHEQYYEAMGRYTDADSLLAAKSDKQYQLLLNNRKLDPQSVEMRKNIQKLASDVEIKIAEVENHLHRMWNAQKRKEKKSARVPVGDTLYRTLKSYEEIARVQSMQLQEMTEQFQKIKLQNEYSSTLTLGLGFSPSRGTPGKKTPDQRRGQRRRLSVVDRERTGEDETGSAPRRVLRESYDELSGTPNGKVYNERMQELKKLVSQRVRNIRRRNVGTPTESPQKQDTRPSYGERTPVRSTIATSIPTTPPAASSSTEIARSKPAAPLIVGEKKSAATPDGGSIFSITTPAASQASFSWATTAPSVEPKATSEPALPAFSLSKPTTAKEGEKAAPKAGGTETPASIGFGSSFAPISFNIPETKPAVSAASPPQKIVPVNLAEAYSHSDDEEEEDEEDEYYDEDEEGDEEEDEDQYSTASIRSDKPAASITGSDSQYDFKPLSNPLVAGDGSAIRTPSEFSFAPSAVSIPSAAAKKDETVAPVSETKSAAGEKDSLSSKPLSFAVKSPVAKSLFASDDSAPTTGFSLTMPAPTTAAATTPAGSSGSASSQPKPTTNLPSFSLSTDQSSTATKSGISTTSSPSPFGTFSFKPDSAEKPAASTGAAATAEPSKPLSISIPTSASAAPTTSTTDAKPFSSFSFTSAPAAGAATEPAKPLSTFSFASASTPAAEASTSSSSSPFGNFSLSSAPTSSGGSAASSAPATSSGLFGSLSAPSGTGASPFASSTPAASGGLFGGLSLGDSSKPAGSPAANPFGTGLSSGTGAAPPASATSGGLFGGTSTSSAAPAAGGLFGAATTPATGGGLFGGSAPAATAPSGGLFGGTSTGSAAAPSTGGLFGAAGSAPAASPFGSGGAFGSTTPSTSASSAGSGMNLFGTTSSLPTLASTTAAPTLGSSPFGGASASPAPAFGAPTPLGGGAPAFGQTAFGSTTPLGSGFGGASSGFGTTSSFGQVSGFSATQPAAGSAAGAGNRPFGSGFASAANTGGGFASLAGGGGGFASLVSGTPSASSPFGGPAPGGDMWGAIRK